MRVTLRMGGGVGGQMRVQQSTVDLAEGTTLAALLDTLREQVGRDVDLPYVLIAVNGWRVDMEDRGNCILSEGDLVAVVGATAGG